MHYELGVLLTPRTCARAIATAAAAAAAAGAAAAGGAGAFAGGRPFSCGPFGPEAGVGATGSSGSGSGAGGGESGMGTAGVAGEADEGAPIRLVTTMAAGAAPAGGLVGRTLALPVPYPLPPRPYDPRVDAPWDIGDRD